MIGNGNRLFTNVLFSVLSNQSWNDLFFASTGQKSETGTAAVLQLHKTRRSETYFQNLLRCYDYITANTVVTCILTDHSLWVSVCRQLAKMLPSANETGKRRNFYFYFFVSDPKVFN